MADDVQPQAEGMTTLHLRALRKDWRVVGLQMVASLALIWLFLTMTQVFGSCHPSYEDQGAWCPALDHTLTLDTMDEYLEDAGGDFSELPIPDWMTGQGNDGDGRYLMPIFIMLTIAAGWVLLNFQAPKLRRKITLGVLGGLIFFLAGMFLLTWTFGMLTSFDLYLPFGHSDESMNHANRLVWPLAVYIESLIVVLILSPVLFGLMGIWGLSKRMINWSVAVMLIYLALYALLSYEGVVNQLADSSDPYKPGLNPLPTQIGEADTLGGLISGEIWSLLLIAILLMVYSETAHAIIRFLEYAFRLPESC